MGDLRHFCFPVPFLGAFPHYDDVTARTDLALVRAARLDDEDAFAEIVDRYAPGMLRYAMRMVGEQDLAADAVQEAFVSAWRNLDSFEGRSTLKTWLYRLAHRRVVDLLRVRRAVPVDDEVLAHQGDHPGSVTLGWTAPSTDPLQAVLDRELLDALRAALLELPEQQRATWLLREIEGMGYQEIAETLGTTAASVRGNLHRARTTLGVKLERWR